MAAWQVDLYIVPRVRAGLRARKRGGANGSVDDVDWWQENPLPPQFTKGLADFLPEQPGWDQNWKIFGTEEGNRLDLLLKNGDVDEIRARIDVRVPDLNFMGKLAALVRNNACVFLNSAGHVIEPTVESLCIEIETSPAASFIADPESFLNALQQRRQSNGESG
jgi:hypothetical protein